MFQDRQINKIEMRSALLQKSRSFFYNKLLLEVDAPVLSPFAQTDPYIDPITALVSDQTNFLHTSPEYFLKRILSKYKKDVFFIGHVFRNHEKGKNHLYEFTMAEWYRIGMPLKNLIHETLEYISLFVKIRTPLFIRYENILNTHFKQDVLSLSQSCLHKLTTKEGSLSSLSVIESIHFLFDRALSGYSNKTLVVTHFPKSECGLAKVDVDHAKRFEIYHNGQEIANGYDELLGSQNNLKRLSQFNKERTNSNKDAFVIDSSFIKDIEYLPSCCGVAVGFDRLLQLYASQQNIAEVAYTHASL